ncbi:MAG: ferric-dicitrate binding protein FerR (iron transport regulator) [Alteromonadaceae bacterium]|jgi:ferric-dicitrate binding protein FerR (iron transport regulator)
MIAPDKDDIWATAWQWAQFPVHDTPDNHQDIKRLNAWLNANPLHRQAYDKAANLWFLTGLVPPAVDH